ncbi:DNA cytosine methyltransferase [Pseudodesulfovibrio methanolicus]|uniref:Cytosine-specific methyltransferase n=1 Tax=Pseudodesulfovibrio methanolicus TaxID=3126690 RepID=A0ABZ2J4C3_9BACT
MKIISNMSVSKQLLNTVDLFSGCGGLSLGFQNAGFNILAAYDNWRLALDVYQRNFDHNAHVFDLSDIQASVEHVKEYNPNVIIGGPPCQDFSIAGKRIEKDRANLTVAFAEIVASVSPDIMVMENVYSIERSKSLGIAKSVLSDAGYGLTSRVIDASRTGVPQMRKRFFLVAAKGFKDDDFGAYLDQGLTERRMTVAEYFGDEIEVEFYYAHPRSYKRRAIFSVHEPSATIRRVNRPIPANYVRHPADKADVGDCVRVLTTEERSRIQTFPKEFIFEGSMSQREHLIANAVPVKMAQYVAEKVLAHWIS